MSSKRGTYHKSAINYSDPSDLTGEFTSIAGDILTLTCSNVTITDTLSQYVDTTANTKIKVNIAQKTANGYTDVAGKGREFTLTDGSLAASDVYEGSDKIATVSYANDNSIEYQKRANFPENIEFSGISLYSDKSIRHHKNTRNFNGN